MEGLRLSKAGPFRYLLPHQTVQKHTLLMKSRLLALSLMLAGIFSTSCLEEDYSDCYNIYKLVMSYKGDGKTEIFPEKINRVEMYVFDESDACISSTVLSDDDVAARTTVLPPLPAGDYRIVCVANTHDTGMENLASRDYSQILFAANDYMDGKTVAGNDSLYYASTYYTIKEFSPMIYEETQTVEFASSHYDVLVEVVNAPENIGRHPKIEIVGVSPQTDFENVAKGKPTDYIMKTVHDGVKTTTARNNIMRHKNQKDVYLKVTGEDGSEVALINFADHIEEFREYIDPSRHECLIPFKIEYGIPERPYPSDDMCAEITISVPEWVVESVKPIF